MGIFNRKGKKAENAVQVNNVSEQTIFACGWDGLWTPHKKGFKPFGKIFLQMALNQIFNGVSNVSFESLKDNYVCNGICSFLDNNATLLVNQWLIKGFMAVSYTKDYHYRVLSDNELKYDSNRRVINRDTVVVYSPAYQISRKGYMMDAMPIVGLLDTLANTMSESCNVMGTIPVISGNSVPAAPNFKTELADAMAKDYGWGADQLKFFLSKAELKVDTIDLHISDLELRENILANFRNLLWYFEVPSDLVIGNSTYSNVESAKTYFYENTIKKYAENILKVGRNLLTASNQMLPQNTMTYHITNVSGLDRTLSDRCKERETYLNLLLKFRGLGMQVDGEIAEVLKDVKKDYREV